MFLGALLHRVANKDSVAPNDSAAKSSKHNIYLATLVRVCMVGCSPALSLCRG